MSVSFTDDHKIIIDAGDAEDIETDAMRNAYMNCKKFHDRDGLCLSCIHYIVPVGCTIGEPHKNWKGWEEV